MIMCYHRLSLLFILAAALLAAAATALPSHWGQMLVKHKWDDLPDNWVSVGHPPDNATIRLYIALKPNRENALIDTLYEVSQPEHPKHVLFTTPQLEAYLRVPLLLFRYGAHLSKEQVAEIVAPHPDTVELVCSWLESSGVPASSISTTQGGGWLTVADVPVSQANELLGASYQLYYHAGMNKTILRTVGYALPSALHIHVKTIVPTTAFAPTQQSPRSRSSGAAAQAANATLGEPVNVLSRVPELNNDLNSVRSFYRMITYVPAAPDENSLGIVGFADEYPSPSPDNSDLRKFMAEYRTDAIAPEVIVVPINGAEDEDLNHPTSVATMEAEYGVAIVYPISVFYFALSGTLQPVISPSGEPGPDDPYFEWLFTLTRQRDLPPTISVGWRFDEQTIPKDYADTLYDLFAELGVRGITVFAASGDEGVGAPEKCKDNSGNVRFYTTFPASCTCGV
jgi:tripeptidyl-peptidase-1